MHGYIRHLGTHGEMRAASWVERIMSLSRWGLSGTSLAAAELGSKPSLLMCVSCCQIMWPSATRDGSKGLLSDNRGPTARLLVAVTVSEPCAERLA